MKWLSVLRMRRAMTFQCGAAFENARRVRQNMRNNGADRGSRGVPLPDDAPAEIVASFLRALMERMTSHRATLEIPFH
ncbi:hypothetical protein FXB40_44375 [Bradyrhizobium rifense]|uniref:Uncharacterized protein n=1 Tax=Bradyrhizobium rifense TaxID=515499 RepID=A0A5D3JZE5_9BRAD|nr:hypothetical protein [Bradyrhizobium rifense]TYL84977.1 hypothetical protein FXB40_44375 [Bradyrhizobium rifense]